MALTKYKLGELIQLEDERNSDSRYMIFASRPVNWERKNPHWHNVLWQSPDLSAKCAVPARLMQTP